MFCSIIGRDCACPAVKESALIAVPASLPDGMYEAIRDGARDGLGRSIECHRLDLGAAALWDEAGRLRDAVCASRYVIVDVTEFDATAAYLLGAARASPDTQVILVASTAARPAGPAVGPAFVYNPSDRTGLSAAVSLAVREKENAPPEESIEQLGDRLALMISSLEHCRTKYSRDITEIEDWAGQLRKLQRSVDCTRRAPNRAARALASELQEAVDYLRSPAGSAAGPGAAAIAGDKQRIADAIRAELDSPRYSESLGAMQKLMLAELGRQARAVGLAERAYVAFDAEDDRTALELFDQAIALDPRYPQAFLGRGRTRADLRQFQPALEDFNRALELDREYAAGYYHRGGAYRNLKDFGKALADYNRALELSPGSPHAHNGRGIVYKALKDPRRAIEEYTRALEADPHYQYALINRARVRWELREYDFALEDFNAALELDPRRAQAYSGRADFFRSQAEHDKALADINRALEIAPGNSDYLVDRGNIFADRKQLDKALADFDRALALRPDSVKAYNNRGAARMQAGDFAGALADFAEAIRLDPDGSPAYNNRAALYCERRQYDLAIADYHRALEAGPGDIVAYLNIAELFIVLDRYQDALIALQKAPVVDYDVNEKAICHYLACVAKRMLDTDARDDERRLNDLLPRVFNVNWSFADLERWLAEADLEPAQRSYIINRTEALKGKAVGQ